MKKPIITFQENPVVDCYEPYIKFSFDTDGNEMVLRQQYDGSKFIDGYITHKEAIAEIKKLAGELK